MRAGLAKILLWPSSLKADRSMQLKVTELQNDSNKKSKNEASRLTKQIARVNKDIKGIDAQLKTQHKELTTEMKQVSKEIQVALKDAFQQAITNVQQPRP